jgi:hypothetical protein
MFWNINRPGLFIKEAGDYKLAWSVAAPLPANLLRELARSGGCHVWCEDDDVVMASDTVAAIHTGVAGPRTLKFPTPRPTWDMLSEESLGVVDRVTMNLGSPETRLFYFGEKSPFERK